MHPERLNKSAPSADGLQPQMPDDFSDDEKRKWAELVAVLDGNGVLSSDTAEILTAYCTAYGGWMEARRKVRQTGIVLVTKGDDGKPDIRRNPFSVELHKYREEMNRLLPELGLTPASRQKLVMNKLEEEDDPFKFILNRMGQG